ncbi:putative ABC1 protein At2g40090 [Bidens hawaiensis]|uniref:putative ABC1 protein At2g40090 n=1 Tax=Bidens hawaiensis TaxID=980011 RepID=UPI00404B03D8
MSQDMERRFARTLRLVTRQFVAVMIMAALTGVPSFLWTTARMGGILTMRPWNLVIDPAVDHLAIQGNDHSERQMYASQYFPQITVLLHKLPRVILLMLKTNDCLRSVNNALIQRPFVESFIIIGRVSSEALIEEKLSHASSLFTYLFVCFEQISLEARFFIMQVALWMLQFRTAFS